jgi:hypothetical protein
MGYFNRGRSQRLAIAGVATLSLALSAYAAAASSGHVYKGHLTVSPGAPAGAVALRLPASQGKVSSFSLQIPLGCGASGQPVTVGGPDKHVGSQRAIPITHGKFSAVETGTARMPLSAPPANGNYTLKISGHLGKHKISGRLTYEITGGGHYCTASASDTGAIRSVGYATTES